MRLPALLFVFVATTGLGCAQTNAHWDYYGKTGPLGWSRLDPAYKVCSDGKEQSPIDIHGAKLNKALQPIEFHYMSASVEVENTGNTIRVNVKPGSYIVANGVRYDLQQFHFHHPGEEAVNGKLTDMDAHLVHKSADGKIAVLAVRLSEDRGDPNALHGGPLAAPSHHPRLHRERPRHDQPRRPPAGRSRLLDLYGLADRPSLHRRRPLVRLRAARQHQPHPVADFLGSLQNQFASAPGRSWPPHRSQRMRQLLAASF